MNPLGAIPTESLAFSIFAVTPIFLTRFVKFFEINPLFAVVVAVCFGSLVFNGLAFLLFLKKKMSGPKSAKATVSSTIVHYSL